MKSQLAYGIATLAGMASSILAIEPPGTAAPIPPRESPDEVVAGPLDMPEVAPPADAARAYLGVGTSQVPGLLGEHLGLEVGKGVVVRSLDPNGPAAKAGISQNDVITKVGGEAIGSHEQLRDLIGGLKPDDAVDVDYIHRGDPKNARVALGTAPAFPPALAEGDVKPLEQLMLDGMPQDQALRIREAIEQNLKAFEGLNGQAGAFPEQLLGGEMQKRIQQMLQGIQIPDGLQVPDDLDGGIHLRSSGTVRMLEPDGSGVELHSHDGGKEVRILGKGGEVEWEGPYDTPQDREAVPQELRHRIERLNIDTDFKGNGLRLRMRQAPAGE